jgi:predicted AAA+ superfamily ATPase
MIDLNFDLVRTKSKLTSIWYYPKTKAIVKDFPFVPRTLAPFIKEDLEHKIVLLSGPRQSGKTYLSKNLGIQFEYLNYDLSTDRLRIMKKEWSRQVELVIFDELHKMRMWKRWLKGIFDVEGVTPRILVTGSARMDVFKKTGDSMAGRHFLYRLHPFSVKEVVSAFDISAEEAIERMLMTSMFPEPWLQNSEKFYLRWKRSHLDRILREDLMDIGAVRELRLIEDLIHLLADRVGSTISYESLGRDLQVSGNTVKRWIEVLESLFVIFQVKPYSKDLKKLIRKEPKIYFYDIGQVTSGLGAKLENLVACHLIKHLHYLEDTEGISGELCFVRDKEKREIDFAVIQNKKLELLVEVKASDPSIHPALYYFYERLKPKEAIQLTGNSNSNSRFVGSKNVKLKTLSDFLMNLAT